MGMRVAVKPRKGDGSPFHIEAHPDDTVHRLKEKVASHQPEMPMRQQKLLFKGQLLFDHKTVNEIGIQEGQQLVLMLSHKRGRSEVADGISDGAAAQVPSAPPPQPPAAEPDQSQAIVRVAAEPQGGTVEPADDDGGAPDAAQVQSAAAMLVTGGTEFENVVRQLCELGGCDQATAERYLRLANGNPDRAADYLFSGYTGPPRPRDARILDQDLDAVSELDPARVAAAQRDLVHPPDPVAAMLAAGHGIAQPPRTLPAPPQNMQTESGWAVFLPDGWDAWTCGHVPFQGQAGEQIEYRVGRHQYRARFVDSDNGVQTNVATGTHRPLRRVAMLPRPAAPAPAPVPGICGRDSLPQVMPGEIEFVVPNLSSFEPAQSVRSDIFTIGDFKFRLLVFPRGTASAAGTTLSVFIEAVPAEGVDADWLFASVKYQIVLVNWIDYRCSIYKCDTWNYTAEGTDRGWHDMARVADLTSEAGWLGPGDSVLLRAFCTPVSPCSIVVKEDGYSSKQRTGYVNLQSPGDGACFTLSLLQGLFHILQFRDLVLAEPCMDVGTDQQNAIAISNMPLLHIAKALQDVFKSLQTSDAAVPCTDLLTALGFSPGEYGECDPTFLIRTLCECLHHNSDAARSLFECELESYIECTDIDFRSVRSESFLSLPLNLQDPSGAGLQSIEASLTSFLAEEVLENENAYDVEGHGKQRAKKRLRVKRLPPVLWLDLKRTCPDFASGRMTKNNGKLEFSESLDLTSLIPESSAYRLSTVLVHAGDAEGGHCCVHVKAANEKWLKVTEGHVLPCTDYAAVQANCGGTVLRTWNYFEKTPEELRLANGRGQPAAKPLPFSACLLGYIREDFAQQL